MPNSAPAKVQVSPKATSREVWISPCGSMYTPQKRSIMPPIESTAAVSSCMLNFSFTVQK